MVALRVRVAAGGTEIVPGQPTLLAVQAVDRQGRTYASNDGTLSMEQVHVVARNGQVTRTSDGLLFVGNQRTEGAGAIRYGITLTYSDDVQRSWNDEFAPDWAAQYGPEPEDVTAIVVEIGPTYRRGDDATVTVAPGDAIHVAVTVRDRRGRIYSTQPGSLPLPGNRLLIAKSDFVVAGPERGTLVPDAERASDGQTMEIAAAYRGRPDISSTVRAVVDFSLIRGPALGDILYFRVTPGSASLIPGSSAPFAAEIRDTHGYVYSVGSRRPPFPMELVRFRSDTLRIDAEHASIQSLVDYASSVGVQYSMDVWLDGREDDTKSTVTMEPDFTSEIRSMVSSRTQFQFSGSEGSDGNDGEYGSGGGGWGSGRGGGQGGLGANGGPGVPGPHVRVLVGTATAFDGRTRFALVVLESEAGGRELLVLPEGLGVQVRSVGGAGGTGGDGGGGGSGSTGAIGSQGTGYNGGPGGDGAAGGNGGSGGPGGPGGQIDVVLSRDGLEGTVAAVSLGGPGGPGGQAGRGGSGGAGGIGGIYTVQGQYGPNIRNGNQGSRGNSGSPGYPGAQGNTGNPGQVRTTVDPTSVYSAIRTLNPRLQEILSFDR